MDYFAQHAQRVAKRVRARAAGTQSERGNICAKFSRAPFPRSPRRTSAARRDRAGAALSAAAWWRHSWRRRRARCMTTLRSRCAPTTPASRGSLQPAVSVAMLRARYARCAPRARRRGRAQRGVLVAPILISALTVPFRRSRCRAPHIARNSPEAAAAAAARRVCCTPLSLYTTAAAEAAPLPTRAPPLDAAIAAALAPRRRRTVRAASPLESRGSCTRQTRPTVPTNLAAVTVTAIHDTTSHRVSAAQPAP